MEVDIRDIKLNPDNPRIIKDEKFKQLVKSIKDFPEMLNIRPIVVNDEMVILGGNMRLKACIEAGIKTIPIIKASSLTPEQQKEFIIKDNIGYGEWSWDMIAADWDIDRVKDWGLDIPPFVLNKETIEDDFEIPDEIETDIILGDLFEIGPHRLLCGDSTNADDVERLMNGQKADITFTSPPYNAGNNRLGGNKNKTASKYENNMDDNIDEWYRLVCAASIFAIKHSIFAFINLQQLAGNKFRYIDFLFSIKEWFVDEMIWYKGEGNPALAIGVLNSRFEKIIILRDEKFPSRAINIKKFKGTISNVYQGTQQTKNEFSSYHAATFPVHLPAHFINCFTMQSILDLFIGTGTTMIAAHQLGRKCYGMEIDPKYCQIIIDRIKKFDPSIEIKKIQSERFEKIND